MSDIKRRDFISLIGGATAAWPLAARAQQRASKVWRLGILMPGAPPEPLAEGMRERLQELGYVEGRNIVLEYRWAEGKLDRLTELATELSAKRLEMLREIVPTVARVAMLWNDTNPSMVLRANETKDAADKLGVIVQSIGVHDLIDFDAAFVAIESGRADALLTLVDPFTLRHRKRIVEFAAQRHLPAIYEAREFVASGGLVSYGPSLVAAQRRGAEYVDKIFKGAKPADLPVEQPTKFEPLINMKTAKALGLDVPPTLLARADEVIE